MDTRSARHTARTVALVPLRSPGEGKTRLSDQLDVTERAALAGAMLADVTSALRDAELERIVVVAAGPAAAAAASALRLEVVLDPPATSSLDDALDAAQRQLGQVGPLLVVTADLPRLRASEVCMVVDAPGEVVIAPTDDGGTGALLRRPADRIRTAYGAGSAHAHRRAAALAGARTTVLELDGFHDDIDTWADVRGLVDGYVGPATAAFLERLGPRLDAAV